MVFTLWRGEQEVSVVFIVNFLSVLRPSILVSSISQRHLFPSHVITEIQKKTLLRAEIDGKYADREWISK